MFQERLKALLVIGVSLIPTTSASAAILYESGTLGATGVSWNDLSTQAVPGTNISQFTFNGVRFSLDRPAVTTKIGGHFVAPAIGTFFGAIVELSGASDFPDSANLSTADVLGSTQLTFPTSSSEVLADLSLSLEPGWYALVFGSGLFGATGNGGAVRNGVDIDDPSYIAFQPGSGFGWVNITTFPNHRFVVTGEVVPEPSAFVLAASAALLAFLRRR